MMGMSGLERAAERSDRMWSGEAAADGLELQSRGEPGVKYA